MKNPQQQQNFHVFLNYFEQKDSKIHKFNTKKTSIKYVDYDFMTIMNQHHWYTMPIIIQLWMNIN